MILLAWIMVVVQLLVSSKLGRLIKKFSNLFLVVEASKLRKQIAEKLCCTLSSLLFSFFTFLMVSSNFICATALCV